MFTRQYNQFNNKGSIMTIMTILFGAVSFFILGFASMTLYQDKVLTGLQTILLLIGGMIAIHHLMLMH